MDKFLMYVPTKALFGAGELNNLHKQTLTVSQQLFDGLVLACFEPGSLNIEDVQKSCSFKADVDEGRLHSRQHAQHPTHIYVADQSSIGCPLNVQIFQNAVNENSNASFARRAVDQNVLHEVLSWKVALQTDCSISACQLFRAAALRQQPGGAEFCGEKDQ